ncbi:MAG: hypothetical protein LBH42_09980 [Treponema sp.]|nr:hypothetical protein [Treponema sp.]
MDLPEGYEYTTGDRKDRYSFESKDGAKFDLSVYYAMPGRAAPYANVEAMARDVQTRLNSKGGIESFEYREKKAILMELSFSIPGNGAMSGWALGMELRSPYSEPGNNPAPTVRPLLLAIAYGPTEKQELIAFHLSTLDSLIPEDGDRLVPGPITELSFPRHVRVRAPIFGMDIDSLIYPDDAEAAQALIDREFEVLRHYENAPNWQEAWKRFYRAIYRDSFDRLVDIAFQVERKLNVPERENRDFANQALQWVQSFEYERDMDGSDFINLVTAATEGRGDCDNRAMLWAIVLKQAGIPSAIMVSRHYGHAMGLADLPGTGARFDVDGQKLLVAETTAEVSIGLIGETVSEIEHWLGVLFE